MEPTTGYATLGNDRIAYQIVGDGPIDLLTVFGFFGSFDIEWEEPAHRLFIQRLTEFARVIRFDQRGVGASDPVPLDALPPWEALAEEMEAVMDAVGSSEAVIFGGGPATQGVLLFVATRPERTRALVLTMAGVRYLQDDDYPIGFTPEALAAGLASFEEGWGTGETFDLMFPSRAGDERLRAWFAKFQRSITSPRAISKFQEASSLADARALLPAVTAPTLVLHPVGNPFLPEPIARYVADNIAGAGFVELDTADVVPYWDHPEVALGIIEEFVTGVRSHGGDARRQMAAVLFTDIVGSTALAEELGDRRWRTLLDLHDGLAADVVAANAGRLVKSTGDGILATFEGPGRAIRAAAELRGELTAVDVAIRAGIHAGEVELRGDGVDGVAVHLAARIMDQAGAGETWVSSTVRDLVFGSDIAFDDRGSHALKGFEGDWHLYEVVTAG